MANNSSSAYLKWKHKQQMPDDTHLIQCNTSIPNHTKPYKLPCILYSIQHTPYVVCALYLLLESMESLSEAQRTQTLFQFSPQLTPESLVEYFTTRWRILAVNLATMQSHLHFAINILFRSVSD